MRAMAAGFALYALLVLALEPLAGAATVAITALKAVVPGFAAGWLRRSRGLAFGAAIGAVGGLLEVALVLLSDLPLGIPDSLLLASVYTVAGGALTNALGGAAGQALCGRGEPKRR